jgi:hypothetical protein
MDINKFEHDISLLQNYISDTFSTLQEEIDPNFCYFLYYDFYHRIYRTLKRQIYELGYYLLSSSVMNVPTVRPLGEIIDNCTKLYQILTNDPIGYEYPIDRVLTFFQSLNTDIIVHLYQVFKIAVHSHKPIYFRMYRSGVHKYSLTFISEVKPQVILVFFNKNTMINYGKDKNIQYGHDTCYFLELIDSKDDIGNEPFKNFNNSFTKIPIEGMGSLVKIDPVKMAKKHYLRRVYIGSYAFGQAHVDIKDWFNGYKFLNDGSID